MRQRLEQVGKFVSSKILRLSQGNNPTAISATLAKLRRGIGKEPGSQPELWEVTLAGLPEVLYGSGDESSFGERAVYAALTLFALHQQGKDIENNCMHEEQVNLGKAMRILILREPDREIATTRRFLATVTADSYDELMWHLRGLIQLLRTQDVKLDYPLLAQDLYKFQFPGNRDSIRLEWGRQFYRNHIKEEESNV